MSLLCDEIQDSDVLSQGGRGWGGSSNWANESAWNSRSKGDNGRPTYQQSSSNWQETVKLDRSRGERPVWVLTCYGHEREKENDVLGDISPEEVRFANLCSMQQGEQTRSLKEEFRRATSQRIDMFQSVARRRQAPSKEGKPVRGNMQCFKNMFWISSQGTQTSSSQPTGFNQATSAPFGGPTQPGPLNSNQSVFSASMSGSQGHTGGFGGSFGYQQGSSAFGSSGSQASDNRFGRGGFGNSVQDSPMQHDPATFAAQGGFGQAQMQQSSTFPGQQPFSQQPHQMSMGSSNFAQESQPRSTSPFGGGFGQASFPVMASDQQSAEISDRDREIWGKPSFNKGEIPEQPPPPALC